MDVRFINVLVRFEEIENSLLCLLRKHSSINFLRVKGSTLMGESLRTEQLIFLIARRKLFELFSHSHEHDFLAVHGLGPLGFVIGRCRIYLMEEIFFLILIRSLMSYVLWAIMIR